MKRGKKLFIKYFFKSFLIVLILVAVGSLSYILIANMFGFSIGGFAKDEMVTIEPNTKNKIQMKSKLDKISKNLIFAWDEENGTITEMVLEIFNTKSKSIHYITIPMKTQLSISEELYKKMLLVNPSLPQTLKLKTLQDYIPEDKLVEYSAVLIEDTLGISISYYTAIPESLYLEVFALKQQGDYNSIYAFTNEFKKDSQSLQSEKELKAYITKVYKNMKTNLSKADKLSYIKNYLKVDKKSISFETMVGREENSGYYLDKADVSKQLLPYLGE